MPLQIISDLGPSRSLRSVISYYGFGLNALAAGYCLGQPSSCSNALAAWCVQNGSYRCPLPIAHISALPEVITSFA